MRIIAILALFLLANAQPAAADIVGPNVFVWQATSPDGNLIVRINTITRKADSNDPAKEVTSYQVAYYEFDDAKDAYVKRSQFELQGSLPHAMNVSDVGDLVLMRVSEGEAIRLYSRSGKLKKSWDLANFLKRVDIRACAQTGSTLQWLDEGAFSGRVFYLRGPAQRVRGLRPPYTIMRGANLKVKFAAVIDAEKATIRKTRP